MLDWLWSSHSLEACVTCTLNNCHPKPVVRLKQVEFSFIAVNEEVLSLSFTSCSVLTYVTSRVCSATCYHSACGRPNLGILGFPSIMKLVILFLVVLLCNNSVTVLKRRSNNIE